MSAAEPVIRTRPADASRGRESAATDILWSTSDELFDLLLV
jgi:hypothetical protein